MLPSKLIQNQLQGVSPQLREIVFEIRNIVVSIVPVVKEVPQSGGYTYYDPRRGGTVSGGICQIIIKHDQIRLAFIHGKFLPDPKGMLEGDMKYKRYIRIISYEQAPWDYLEQMISASSQLDIR